MKEILEILRLNLQRDAYEHIMEILNEEVSKAHERGYDLGYKTGLTHGAVSSYC